MGSARNGQNQRGHSSAVDAAQRIFPSCRARSAARCGYPLKKSMKIIAMKTVLVAAVLVLGGCGWMFGDKGMFRDRGDDYRRATVEKPLEIPPGLNKSAIEDEAAIPPIAYSASLEGKF